MTTTMIINQVSLYFQQGSSDKEYHAQLEEKGDGYVVNFQYGRRGSALKSGTKTASPVSLEQAEKIYHKLVHSKRAKGYIEGESSSAQYVGNATAPKEVVKLPQLLNMVDSAMEFIDDDSYLAQEKMDGERRMVVSSGSPIGLNKKGQEVPLPSTVVDVISGDCILDGEIIQDLLHVFDLLSLGGEDLEGLSCIERVQTLNTLSFGNGGIVIVPTAFTREEKLKLFRQLEKENREGIVFKKKNAPYTPGRPNSGGAQVKFKFYKTATFVVADMTTGKRSVGLELDDNGKMVFMGKVTIPPNKDVPKIGDFVEVRYLYAYKGGAIFQPTYLAKRGDCDITDATLGQIVYKNGS